MLLIAKINQCSEAVTSKLVLAALAHLAQDSPNVDGTRWKTQTVGFLMDLQLKVGFKKPAENLGRLSQLRATYTLFIYFITLSGKKNPTHSWWYTLLGCCSKYVSFLFVSKISLRLKNSSGFWNLQPALTIDPGTGWVIITVLWQDIVLFQNSGKNAFPTETR